MDPSALRMLLMALTGWLDRREREALAYLIEENRLLCRRLRGRRLQWTDDDRRPVATVDRSGKISRVSRLRLRRSVLCETSCRSREALLFLTPDTHRAPTRVGRTEAPMAIYSSPTRAAAIRRMGREGGVV